MSISASEFEENTDENEGEPMEQAIMSKVLDVARLTHMMKLARERAKSIIAQRHKKVDPVDDILEDDLEI